MSLEEAEKEERDASTRIITQITLDCLLNKEQYSKYLNATMSKTMESSKRDRKFYKRRILQMTKDLLLSEEIDTPSDMLFAFDQFARSCISYFKMIDKTDILQTDYPPLDEPLINAGELTPFKDSAESLMRSVKINAITMDKFVKRISTAPVKAPVIPQMRDINLKDPELRNKGIRKKKNVDTLYAEKNNEEKETESI
jgi:hypothetical protein